MLWHRHLIICENRQWNKMIKLLLTVMTLMGYVSLACSQSCGRSPGIRPTRRSADGQRIVGGQEARPNSHPWLVSLQLNGSHFCGGSLISSGSSVESDIVLTAAHCVQDGVNLVTVAAGAHDLWRTRPGQQTVAALRAFLHPQYNNTSTINDIGIVKLATPIRFSPTIQPACLPRPGEQVDVNTLGIIAGWGLTREGGFLTSNILMQVGVPTVPTTACARLYSIASIRILPEQMFCAGYREGGRDACQGDSGGPFMFQSGGIYTQQGVVSFGIGCARPGLPGVYTRVSNYIPWIQSVIRESNLPG